MWKLSATRPRLARSPRSVVEPSAYCPDAGPSFLAIADSGSPLEVRPPDLGEILLPYRLAGLCAAFPCTLESSPDPLRDPDPFLFCDVGECFGHALAGEPVERPNRKMSKSRRVAASKRRRNSRRSALPPDSASSTNSAAETQCCTWAYLRNCSSWFSVSCEDVHHAG